MNEYATAVHYSKTNIVKEIVLATSMAEAKRKVEPKSRYWFISVRKVK